MAKPFLPRTRQGAPVADARTSQWVRMAQARGFIEDIETNRGNEEAGINTYNALISGVPSPWARVKITAYALKENIQPDDNRTLMRCYAAMRKEWRGLLATFILRPDQFYLSKPIALPANRVDEMSQMRTDRISILSTMGEMLFDDAPLWHHGPRDHDGQSFSHPPYIQLLYYKIDENHKVLVGATSPYTIFFTSVGYNIDVANGITSVHNGKFSDPAAKRRDDPDYVSDLKKIYSFLNRIASNKKAYGDTLTDYGLATDMQARYIEDLLDGEVLNWKQEIAQRLGQTVDTLDRENVPVFITDDLTPRGPLGILFTNNVRYSWLDGSFLVNRDEGIAIDSIDSLFVQSPALTGWKPLPEFVDEFEKAPVYYLKAKDNSGDIYYFALPLSAMGISLMKDSLDSILNPNENSKVRIVGDVKDNVVDVKLQIRVNNGNDWVEILLKTYTIVPGDTMKKVFTWPNFKSTIWNTYFYYSEFPSNLVNTTRIIPEFEGLEFNDELVHSREDMPQTVDYLVTYPVGQANANDFRYEVLKSDTPLNYITIITPFGKEDVIAGRLILKTSDDPRANALRQIQEGTANAFTNVKVGIDFGSTNSCAYYLPAGANSEDARNMPFSNLRLAIMGTENEPRRMASRDELLFISNEEPINANGQVKSWIHLHNPLYVSEAREPEAVVGGVPVNETNITVVRMDDRFITTNAGSLAYDMKWRPGKEGNNRTSYINMLWLHICADLFNMGFIPEEVRWSYPSSMKDNSTLSTTFSALELPINGKTLNPARGFTEAEAVCKFSQIQKGVAPSRFTLGIDVGGSTSDILILGRDNNTGLARLFTQCSVRLAAGRFFEAIKKSRRFRETLVRFHQANSNILKNPIHVEGIEELLRNTPDDANRAPYYLNNVFDQIQGQDDFRRFYEYMREYVPFVFAIPAFTCGLLCFYSGVLLRDVLTRNPEKRADIRQIFFQYFGKGGRLFEWIYDVYGDEALDYLSGCIITGMDDYAVDDITYINFEPGMLNNMNENKTEVAKGLVSLEPEGDKRILGIEFRGSSAPGTPAKRVNKYARQTSAVAEESTVNTGPSSLGHEVIGERDIEYIIDPATGTTKVLSELDVITDEMMQHFERFNFDRSRLPNFNTFISIFTDFISETNIVDERTAKTLMDQAANVDIGTYLGNNLNASGETAHMPIFVAAGLRYLDSVLLPTVFKN